MHDAVNFIPVRLCFQQIKSKEGNVFKKMEVMIASKIHDTRYKIYVYFRTFHGRYQEILQHKYSTVVERKYVTSLPET